MLDPEGLAGERMDRGAVGVAVVGHQSFDPDAEGGVVRDGAAQEANRGDGLFVVEHLDVDEPGRVIDRDVHILPADPAAPDTAIAVDAVTGLADPAELLDVDVDEFARPAFLMRVWRLWRPAAADARPSGRRRRERSVADDRRRSRRNEAMTAARVSSVRDGTDKGAEQRSNRPSRPRPGNAAATSKPYARSRRRPRPPP